MKYQLMQWNGDKSIKISIAIHSEEKPSNKLTKPSWAWAIDNNTEQAFTTLTLFLRLTVYRFLVHIQFQRAFAFFVSELVFPFRLQTNSSHHSLMEASYPKIKQGWSEQIWQTQEQESGVIMRCAAARNWLAYEVHISKNISSRIKTAHQSETNMVDNWRDNKDCHEH